MSTKEPKPIRFDEVMKKLDEFRVGGKGGKYFTEQMDKLLLSSRTGVGVVPYTKIQELWKQLGWGDIAASTLMARLRKLEAKK
jgi:hypothetical protein